MGNDDRADGDADIEAQWHDEIGGALETAASLHRRLAGLLRVARGAVPAVDLEQHRLQVRRSTYRIVEVLKRIDDLTRGGVGP
jgi:hypothetical protein